MSDATPRGATPAMGREALLFFSVVAFVFASRLPFLGAGYGNDSDAWRIALAGRVMAVRGGYTVSRFPGYPIPEMTASLLSQYGPEVLNAVTALMSAVAAGSFALTLRALRCRGVLAGVFALAFTPVIFIHSTDAMDYLWALAFALSSLRVAIARRPIPAGLLLGLGIGCRMTTGAMTLPLALLLTQGEPWRSAARKIVAFWIATGGVAGLAFLPVVRTYGFGFLTYIKGQVPPTRFYATMTLGTWGQLGTAALVIAVIAIALRPLISSAAAISHVPGWRHPVAWGMALALYLTAFCLLPMDAGYLIPTVPFVILFLARFLPRLVFFAVCLLIGASSFFSLCPTGICDGPILQDHRDRIANDETVGAIVAESEEITRKGVLIVGPRALPRIKALLPVRAMDLAARSPATNESPAAKSNVTYVSYLDEQEMAARIAQGYTIYYLPGAVNANMKYTGLDLRVTRAIPFSLGRAR